MFKKITDMLLASLAKKIIKKYQPQVIGITGSVGKTSTKEAIFEVLKDKFNVRKNIKNYNTEIGVPLTIIGAETGGKNIFKWIFVFLKALKLIYKKDKNYPEILILEMAADHPGDISHLVKIAPCDIAVLTAVSETHLEFFGNVEEVKKEKQILVSHLNEKGTAIINIDDEITASIIKNAKVKVLSCGFSENAQIKASELNYVQNENNDFNYLMFKITANGSTVPFKLKNCISQTHIYAVLPAVAVGILYEMNLIEISQKLENFAPPKGRMNLITGIKQTKIIDDTYNSSPKATAAALEVLAQLHSIGRKIAVLGDMLELGSQSEELHGQVGNKVAESKIDILITVGERARDIARGAEESGMNKERMFSFADIQSAGTFLQERIEKGDLILIKGSQAMRMEKIVKEIMAEPMRASELLVRQEEEWI